MEALADLAHSHSSMGELDQAQALLIDSLEIATELKELSGILVARWGLADLAEIETRYDDALLVLSDAMHLFMQLGIPAPDLLKKRLHALTSLDGEVK